MVHSPQAAHPHRATEEAGLDLIRRDDAIAALRGAFAECAASIRAQNARRGGGLTLAGHDLLARNERGLEVALSAIQALGPA